MSYALRGPRREWRTNIFGWEKFLKRADANGWEPAGTEAPSMMEVHPDGTETTIDLPRWGGGYCSNDYQSVTDADAAALADAVERWLEPAPRPKPALLERYLAYRCPAWDAPQPPREPEEILPA